MQNVQGNVIRIYEYKVVRTWTFMQNVQGDVNMNMKL